MFKLSFIVVFVQMVHYVKLFRRSSVKYRTFLEGPTWSDLFPYVVRKNEKLSKIVAYTVKIMKLLVRKISEHP